MGETVTYCHKYQITGAQMIPRAIDGLQVINETIGRHGSDTYGDDVRGGNRGINMKDDKVADMVLMIPNEDFLMKLWRLLIVVEIMLKVMVWVLDMEVDKIVQSGGWWMCKIYELY